MEQSEGRTREAFAALGSFHGDAERLYDTTRRRDFDIQLWDWIAAASPRPELSPIDQIEGWAWAWLYCSRWAGTVGRQPASVHHAERAGIGPLLQATGDRIVEIAESWRWPAIDELETLDDGQLETSYALLEAANHIARPVPRRSAMTDDEDEFAVREQAWRLALRLELKMRGQLPRVYTEVSEYDGSERILLEPTQLFADVFGRPLPRSRLKRIVDEWCEFFEAGPTPIRYLDISSRAPKRLITALRGQAQLRGLAIKWGDYDDVSAIAGMPDLWSLRLGGASGLTELAPLRSATSLRVLELEASRRLTDYSPLGALSTLEEFRVTGSTAIPTIAFVRGLTGLRHLLIGARVLDEDYSPLLELAGLEKLRVHKQRTMHPSYEELEERIAGMRSH